MAIPGTSSQGTQEREDFMTAAIASPVAAPLLTIYRTNGWQFKKALDGLTEDELWYTPTEDTNPMLWIAGHILDTRAVVLKLLGEEFPRPWKELFTLGSVIAERALYPSVSEIQVAVHEVSERFKIVLSAVDDEFLAQPQSGLGLPNSVTRADEIAFFAQHEAYHVGQMAYLRKALGHGRLGR
jgi:uncharacterized damage-inducible protein DinB